MNSDCPLVSVIIPVFNAARFLPDAIDSVNRQNYSPLEIIVVDDGSTDDTASVARAHANVRYLYQENSGPAAARNRGIEAARGEIIGFLDADDLWPSNKLEIQLGRLLADPTLDVVLGRVQYVALEGATVPEMYFEGTEHQLLFVHLGNALYRRRAFERVGLLDPTMRFAEDHDWFLRARESGLRMDAVRDITLVYRLHESNMTRSAQDLPMQGLFQALQKSIARRRASGDPERQLPQFTDYDDLSVRLRARKTTS